MHRKRRKKLPAESEKERKVRFYKEVLLTKEVKAALVEWLDANSVSDRAPNLQYADVREYMLRQHQIRVIGNSRSFAFHFILSL
jgi:hypothetical protein